MPPLKKINRREFLATSASAASLMIVPSGAFAVSKTSPQNKLNVAFIGMGGQIQGHVQNILRQEHNVTVMCDVDENQLAKAKDRYGEYLEKTNFYTDYRKLFEKEKSIDAVVIATPDHWHAPICKMAIEAGKHVYCEKPLAHTVSEARMLRELSRESKVVTQMGNQGSASSGIRRSIELIQADVFGDISRIHVWHPEHNWPSGESRPDGADAVPEGFQWDFWCGPSPLRAYKKGIYHPEKWRGWYDFGNGSLGDFCCHGFNLPVRALELDYPTRIDISGKGLGFESFSASSTTRFHFPAKGNRKPVELSFYTGGDLPPKEVFDVVTKSFGGVQGTGCILEGEKGMLSAGLWNNECRIKMNDEERFVHYSEIDALKEVPQNIPRIKDHLTEWVDAILTGSETFSDFDTGGHLTEIGLAGTVALRLEKNIEWDGPNMKAPGTPEADILIHKENRTQWL